MQVDRSELGKLDLRAHQLLFDVPLHDVWRLHLSGAGPQPPIGVVVDRFVAVAEAGAGPGSRILFGVRRMAGRVFGWDREDARASSRSYVGRLTTDERARSLEPPGSKRGFWTTVYTFDDEALGEVINRTVHAFLLFALAPAKDGHALYWAIYVKPVNRFTALYMAAIDPFRRKVIYPSLIRRFEADWAQRDPSSRPLFPPSPRLISRSHGETQNASSRILG